MKCETPDLETVPLHNMFYCTTVAAHGRDNMPFVDDLCAKRSIDKEIADLVATI